MRAIPVVLLWLLLVCAVVWIVSPLFNWTMDVLQ